jgi:hypothetical protein
MQKVVKSWKALEGCGWWLKIECANHPKYKTRGGRVGGCKSSNKKWQNLSL